MTPTDPGTIAGDCKGVFSKGTENTQTWTFYWTAPQTGEVSIHWGAVDGDCLMMSMNDAVVEGTRLLRAPAMVRAQHQPRWPASVVGVLVAGLFVMPRRRRHRDPTS